MPLVGASAAMSFVATDSGPVAQGTVLPNRPCDGLANTGQPSVAAVRQQQTTFPNTTASDPEKRNLHTLYGKNPPILEPWVNPPSSHCPSKKIKTPFSKKVNRWLQHSEEPNALVTTQTELIETLKKRSGANDVARMEEAGENIFSMAKRSKKN